MPKPSPLSEVVAARCAPGLIAKLDELREILAAASPIAVQVNRSDVARAAIERGVDDLLREHRKLEEPTA